MNEGKKFEKPKKEERLELDVNLEISEEDYEKYKHLEDEVESLLMGFDLTEEDIEEGLEPMEMASLEPISFLEEEIPDFDDPAEEEKARRVVLKFAFEQLGFDPKNPKLVKEETVQGPEEEFTEKHFETNNPDLFLVFNGVDWRVEKKKEE